MSTRTVEEVHTAITDNTSLLAEIMRLVPDVDPDTLVPCTNDLKRQCPLLTSYQPTTLDQALFDVRAQVRRLQHALGRAQLMGAHDHDLERALGDGNAPIARAVMEALVPDPRQPS